MRFVGWSADNKMGRHLNLIQHKGSVCYRSNEILNIARTRVINEIKCDNSQNDHKVTRIGTRAIDLICTGVIFALWH